MAKKDTATAQPVAAVAPVPESASKPDPKVEAMAQFLLSQGMATAETARAMATRLLAAQAREVAAEAAAKVAEEQRARIAGEQLGGCELIAKAIGGSKVTRDPSGLACRVLTGPLAEFPAGASVGFTVDLGSLAIQGLIVETVGKIRKDLPAHLRRIAVRITRPDEGGTLIGFLPDGGVGGSRPRQAGGNGGSTVRQPDPAFLASHPQGAGESKRDWVRRLKASGLRVSEIARGIGVADATVTAYCNRS